MKKWVIKNNYNKNLKLHSNKLISNLLSSRGFEDESEINEFLYPDINKLHNPFLLRDMNRAIDRIDEAIKKRQKIVIYGDYDVDGITSTSILYRAFLKLGVDASYYIPDRMNEGYGINKGALDYIKSLGTDLIITVDCGITSIDEVQYAKDLKIDIIITDHHECKETIPDTIVINPKRKDCNYPNKSLAGCGISFKLVQALWIRYNLYGFEDFLDIAAIGTIADIVELKGENRIIVKNGLKKINSSEKCGIKALKIVADIGDNINSYNIAFQLAPRINAVGRLSDAKIAVELFVTSDYDKALQIAKFLDQENKKRQKIEEEILNDALIQIQESVDVKKDKVIILSSDNWHHGVVGIVASKLVERFNRPAILLCIEGTVCKGSGRSIKGFNLFESLCECSELLIKYGGHEMAAGLSLNIDNINNLRDKMNLIGNRLSPEIYAPSIYAELETNPEDISLESAEELQLFQPYGSGNPSPMFYMEGLNILSIKAIGASEKHLKLNLGKNGIIYNAILFNRADEFKDKQWEIIDIMYNLDINDWNNNKSLQFMLKDMRANTLWVKKKLEDNYYRFLKFMFNGLDSNYNFEGVNFIRKDINFLNEFIYLKKGYILISCYESLKEIEHVLDYIDINLNRNFDYDSQVILCPNIRDITSMDNDILIYDFLPGQYEYEQLVNKSKGCVYNFYDEYTLNKIDTFVKEIEIDKDLADIFNKDLLSSEFTGTIKELAFKYNRNAYIIYKMITQFREKNSIDIMIKNDILKIRIKHNNCTQNIIFNDKDCSVEKLLKLKQNLNTLLGEEIEWI